jgi:8-oxo-dGTP pyrophosphatase MutT (NUDIX family)
LILIVGINNLTQEEIKKVLNDKPKSGLITDFPVGLLNGPPRPAAVLIPLFYENNAWHVLFIRRTSSLAEHSGQVAFPGGRSDSGDLDSLNTALRESQEEIGLNPDDVIVLGHINELLTITNYQVMPFVGVIPWPYPFRRAESEVARIFSIPLDWLVDPTNHEERHRILPEPYPPINVIYFQTYDSEVLWGVTARLVLDFVAHLNSL